MPLLVALAAVTLALSPSPTTAVGARISAPVGDRVHLHVGLRNNGTDALRPGIAVVRLPGNVAVLSADRHCVRRDQFGHASYRCKASAVAPKTRALFTFDLRVRKSSGPAGVVEAGDRADIVVTGTDGPQWRLPAYVSGRLPGAGGYALIGAVVLIVGLGGLVLSRRRAS